ncbi:hypothetical protein PSACC_01155 [Paramicrosporidium saccamoebae]|uniref:Tyrosine specific protein phosphatases domain-containing protein n=1 Tax=Paramicrosporidium saccamoebae TaxID=1246581 RepID=A0A2H9TMR5_9FUNG|nr:hypothetical protein PSACC_01155 [Paramicrosporidium saccamoebae]
MKLSIIVSPLVGASLCPPYSQNEAGNATRELVLNECPPTPRRYRSVTDNPAMHFKPYHEQVGPVPPLDLTGYEATRMSGSAQFCGNHLTWLKNAWGGETTVVDLRMESHGFLDDQAVGLFCPRNWDRLHTKMDDLTKNELDDFKKLAGQHSAIVYEKPHDSEKIQNRTQLKFTTARTEGSLLEAGNVKYVRIYMPDHRRPRDREVQQFVELNESASTWLHFHCKAGKGRTTMAMIMRDMLINHQLPAQTLIQRNNVYGRLNLTDIEKMRGTYKEHWVRERVAFLYMFYEFTKTRHPNLSWYDYLGQQSERYGAQMVQSLGSITCTKPVKLIIAGIEDDS